MVIELFSCVVQNMKDVFGELTRKRALHMGDYVIALPLKGTCINQKQINVVM